MTSTADVRNYAKARFAQLFSICLSNLVCGIVCWCAVQAMTVIVGVCLGFVSVRALPNVFSLAGTMVPHFFCGLNVTSEMTPKEGVEEMLPSYGD